jgi:nucleoside-diphosphate-sugar epimerase
MARGKKGRRYLISSRFMTMDDLLDEFSAVTGRPKPRLRLPVPVMSVASRAWSQTVGRFKPNAVQRLTPGAIHILAMHRHADLSLARTELGYEPTTDVRETIREWYDFFVREGMIPHG